MPEDSFMAQLSETLERLRTVNERALERAGYDPSIQVTVLRVHKRTRIQKLLEKRARIDALASTDDQIADYGAERWRSEFIRLGGVERALRARATGEELRSFIWRWVPNTRFKRFQELFCTPANFVVPPFSFDERGRVQFHGRPDFHSFSLRPCLVSPDRIPDKFAQDVGLCSFAEEDDEIVRLEKKRAAIPRLKLLFASAQQLQQKHHRVLMVEEPAAQLQREYRNVEEPPERSFGTILYTRSSADGNGLTVQHFDSVYNAYRKTFHEYNVYHREIVALAGMKQEIGSMNRTLNVEWRRDTPEQRRAELRSAAKALLEKCRDSLLECDNRFKVSARDLLTQIQNLTDKSGKENISATMSRMVAVLNQLEKRFRDMYQKGGYNQQDQFVLQQSISEHETTMRAFRDHIVAGAPHLFDDPPVLAGVHPGGLDAVRLEPFRTYAAKLRAKHGELSRALASGDRETAIDRSIEMHVIGKFQAVRTCFEHVKKFVMDAEAVPVSRIRDFVALLRDLFSTRQLFPERTVAAYQEPFERMETALEGIERGLAHYAGQDMDVDTRSEVYGRLKEYLERFDIEAIVRELP